MIGGGFLPYLRILFLGITAHFSGETINERSTGEI